MVQEDLINLNYIHLQEFDDEITKVHWHFLLDTGENSDDHEIRNTGKSIIKENIETEKKYSGIAGAGQNDDHVIYWIKKKEMFNNHAKSTASNV